MSEAGAALQPNHILRIDVLRAAAIVMVFTSHFDYQTIGAHGEKWVGNWWQWADAPSLLALALRLTLFNGHLGVSLFFVISGLCIRLSQIGSKSFSVPYFYWRRFWRIYPPYVLCMALCLIWHRYGNLNDILFHIVLIHNFSLEYFYSINGPFWSLALEVQVYLLFPCLLALHTRFGVTPTALSLAVLSVIPGIVATQTFRATFHLPPAFEIAAQLPTSLWFTWYMGFLLADALVRRDRPALLTRAVLLMAIAGYAFFTIYRPFWSLHFPAAGVMLTLLIFEYLSGPVLFPRAVKLISYLGLCSYSFYLYFDPLIYPSIQFLKTLMPAASGRLLFLVGYYPTLLAIFAFSYVAYTAVESRSIALGQTWYKRLKKPVLSRPNAPLDEKVAQ